MSRGERIALWVLVGVAFLWLAVLTAVALGEMAYIRQALRERETTVAEPGPVPTAPPAFGQERGSSASGAQTEKFAVGVGGVEIISDTLVLTVTVRSSGVGELLYEPPIVTDGRQEYPIDGESLSQARFAFLDLVTKGTATARLVFSPAPDPGVRLTLVFNPRQQPYDLLTPRVEVPVPVPAE